MTTTFPQAILTKKDSALVGSILSHRPEKSLMNKRVLVDCKKGRQAITVAFYDHSGCHCSIWINQWTNDNYLLRKLDGHGKGSTDFKALVAALNDVGVTLDSPIPVSLGIDKQIEGVMHSIADALKIEHPRVITHAWR